MAEASSSASETAPAVDARVGVAAVGVEVACAGDGDTDAAGALGTGRAVERGGAGRGDDPRCRADTADAGRADIVVRIGRTVVAGRALIGIVGRLAHAADARGAAAGRRVVTTPA